jgi:hypothetical protein
MLATNYVLDTILVSFRMLVMDIIHFALIMGLFIHIMSLIVREIGGNFTITGYVS